MLRHKSEAIVVRPKDLPTSLSGFKHVQWDRTNHNWISKVRIKGKLKHIGSGTDSPENLAHRVARELRKPFLELVHEPQLYTKWHLYSCLNQLGTWSVPEDLIDMTKHAKAVTKSDASCQPYFLIALIKTRQVARPSQSTVTHWTSIRVGPCEMPFLPHGMHF